MPTENMTLAGWAWPAAASAQWLRGAALALLGSVLLWVSAKIQVPFYPVPQTLQSLVVLTIGAAYGWRLGAATVVLYLIEGAFGLPVFAGTPEKGIGLAYMMGPTGGYLIGFILAAAAVGWLAERGFDRSVPKMFAAMLAGTIIVYLPGLPWLAQFTGWDKALQFGLYPFLWGDLLKAALAAAIFPAIWQLIGRR